MSYRDTFKRVFAETSLERKCRWWFGISLSLLIFLSFYWYSGRTYQTVYDGVRRQAKQLVETAYIQAHMDIDPRKYVDSNAAAGPLSDDVSTSGMWEIYADMMSAGRFYGTDFSWDTVIPPGGTDLNPPQDPTETDLLERYMAARLEPRSPESDGGEESIDEDLDLPEGIEAEHRIVEIDGGQQYQYYRPIYARADCVYCHKSVGKSARPTLREGELLAIMRIKFDHGPTARKLATNTALLWTAAIVTGILSMVIAVFRRPLCHRATGQAFARRE